MAKEPENIQIAQAVKEESRKRQKRGKRRGKQPNLQNKMPRHKETKRIEQAYGKQVRKIFLRVREIINAGIIEQLPSIVEQAEMERQRVDGQRFDAPVSMVMKGIFASTRRSLFGGNNNKREIEAAAQEFGFETDKVNSLNLKKAFKASLGIDIAADDVFLNQQMEMFVANNIQLINGVQEQMMNEIEQVVTNGVMKGERAKDIAAKIMARNKDPEGFRGRFIKAETRAKGIARDQVLKLNSSINEQRQQSVGIKKYIWRTARDERVRGEPYSHRLEGEIFEWGKNKSENGKKKPRGTLNPGEDFNCRCYAEPYIEEFVE